MLMLLISSIIGGVLAGGLCGAVGAICSRLKLTTMAFSMAHAALAGSALALALGADIISLAMLLAIATAMILGPLADHLGIPIDLASMTLFSLYNALAFIFIISAPGPALMTESVGQLLWGSILATRPMYIAYLLLASMIVLALLIIFWGKISSILFDIRLAEAEGVNVKAYKYAILVIAGTTVTLALRMTGGFLVFSLLYVPAAASLQLQANMKGIIAASWIFGSASASMGLLMSFLYDLPAGSCITIAALIILLAASAYSRLRASLAAGRRA